MVLTKQQQGVLDSIKEFLNSDVSVFILKGYAGTGKTTMISHIINEVAKLDIAPVLMAPTGRAARVLESKTKHGASTIQILDTYFLSRTRKIRHETTSVLWMSLQ